MHRRSVFFGALAVAFAAIVALVFFTAPTIEPVSTAAKAAPELKEAKTPERKVKMKMTTSEGVIVLELFEDKAPETVANFRKYAADGHYNGTVFHRVIKGFMIQGGGFEPGLIQKSTSDPIQNEADNGVKNDTGTIAMARTGDPHSASAQFFINTVDNAMLDHRSKSDGRSWGYAVFGRVIEGMPTVRVIEKSSTHNVGPYGDVPRSDVTIIKAEVLP